MNRTISDKEAKRSSCVFIRERNEIYAALEIINDYIEMIDEDFGAFDIADHYNNLVKSLADVCGDDWISLII